MKSNNLIKKLKVKLSMVKLYKVIENALGNTDELFRNKYLDDNSKQLLNQVVSSGRELLVHIKNYVKNDISLLLASGKKSKIKNKKKIVSIFSQKSTLILGHIASIQIKVLQQQYRDESKQNSQEEIVIETETIAE